MIELRNINGTVADIYSIDSNCFIITWDFGKTPVLAKNEIVSVKQLVNLKEAGFDANEIIKMLKELRVE